MRNWKTLQRVLSLGFVEFWIELLSPETIEEEHTTVPEKGRSKYKTNGTNNSHVHPSAWVAKEQIHYDTSHNSKTCIEAVGNIHGAPVETWFRF